MRSPASTTDGIIRTPFVAMQYGDAVYKLFEETKKIGTRRGYSTPVRKSAGTLEYAFSHIVEVVMNSRIVPRQL